MLDNKDIRQICNDCGQKTVNNITSPMKTINLC